MSYGTEPTIDTAAPADTKGAGDGKLLALLNTRLRICKDFWGPQQKDWKAFRQAYMIGKSRLGRDISPAGSTDQTKSPSFQIAYSFSNTESIKSSLFDQPPTWVSAPRKNPNASVDYFKAIKAIPKALETIWDNEELSELIDDAVDNFTQIGIGGQKLIVNDRTPMIEQTVPAIKLGPITIRKEKVVSVPGDPDITLVYSSINPYRFMIAPDSKSWKRWDDIPYVIETFCEEVDVARQMLDDPNVQSTGVLSYGDADDKAKEFLKKEKRVDFFEYWGYLPADVFPDNIDLKFDPNKRYHILWTTKKIYITEENPFNDGEPPYEVMINYVAGATDDIGAIVPFGDIKPIYHLEEEISETRAASVIRRKRHARSKILIIGAAEFDETALKSPEHDAIVRVEDGNTVQFLEPSNNDGGLAEHSGQIREDISIISGINDLSRGADTQSTIQTATGQRLEEAARSKRMKKKYRQIALMLERLGLKTLNRLAQYSPIIWVDAEFDEATGQVVNNEVDLSILTNPTTGLVDLSLKVKLGSQTSLEKEVLREQRRALYEEVIMKDGSIDPNFRLGMLRQILEDYDLDEADQLTFAPAAAMGAVIGDQSGLSPTGQPTVPGAPAAPTGPAPAGLPGVPGLSANNQVKGG